MIDLNLHLGAIEKLMELMAKYELDEISCDFVNLKKSRHRGVVLQAIDEKALLEKHLSPPHDNEPWLNAVSQETADKWAAGGGP